MALRSDVWIDEGEPDDIELMEEDYRASSRDAVLICIDASSTMHEPQSDQDQETKAEQYRPEASFFEGSLRCAIELMKGKALTSPSDLVGVVIFNTRKEPREDLDDTEQHMTDPKGIYTLIPIGSLDLEPIKYLIDLSDHQESNPDFFQETFPPLSSDQPSVSPGQLFSHCNGAFRSANIRTGSRRVFLVTDDDNPMKHLDDPNQARQAVMAAKTHLLDLQTIGASVVPFLLGSEEKLFDVDLFWQSVLSPPGIEPNLSIGSTGLIETEFISASEGLVDFRELLAQMTIRQTSKRAIFSLPMIIGSGKKDSGDSSSPREVRRQLVIGIQGYAHIVQAKKSATKMTDASGEVCLEAIPQIEYYDSLDTEVKNAFDPENLRQTFRHNKLGDPAPPLQRDYAAQSAAQEDYLEHKGFGTKELIEESEKEKKSDIVDRGKGKQSESDRPEQITYSLEEISQLKSLGISPGISILGFVSRSFLTFEMNIKNSYFIFPNEHTYTGSRRTFASLNKTLLEKDKIGLGLCLFRKGSMPIFCALIPQEETFDEDERQDKAPGFHLVPLPFKDDIRGPPRKIEEAQENASYDADEMHVETMRNIIRKLQKDDRYLPEQFPNPTLSRYNAHLQAIAFDEPFGEEEAERIQDKTEPLAKDMIKRAGKLMKQFKEGLFEDERILETVEKPRKRKVGIEDDSDDALVSAKKTKSLAREMDIASVREEYRAGRLSSTYRVIDLVSFLKSISVSCPSKNKADLVKAIELYFERELK